MGSSIRKPVSNVNNYSYLMSSILAQHIKGCRIEVKLHGKVNKLCKKLLDNRTHF